MDFEKSIKKIRQARPTIYKTFTLDLSTARSEYELPVAGNYLVMIDATDLNSNIQMRFNEISADALTLKTRQGWKIPFYRLYITNTAQAGKSVTLAYGISETPLERIDQAAIFDIQSIADPVDISDRAARLLGVVDSVTNPVDISDRSNRDLGQVDTFILGHGIDYVNNYWWSVVDPAAGQVLATSADMPGKNYSFSAFVVATVQSDWKIGVRSADNLTFTTKFKWFTGANDGKQITGMLWLLTNEQIELQQGGAITGNCEGFLNIWRLRSDNL